MHLHSRAKIVAFLAEACEASTFAWLRDGSDSPIAGTFASLDGRSVSLAVAPDRSEAGLHVHDLEAGREVDVRFTIGQRERKFVSTPFVPAVGRGFWARLGWARARDDGESHPDATSERGRLRLWLPSEIRFTRERRAFRVPVRGFDELEIRIEHRQGGALPGRFSVVDVSALGIGIVVLPSRVVGDTSPRWSWRLGQRVRAELRYGDDVLSLAADCARVRGDVIGLTFPESLRGQDVAPPLALAKLLRQLERRWLRQRTEIGGEIGGEVGGDLEIAPPSLLTGS